MNIFFKSLETEKKKSNNIKVLDKDQDTNKEINDPEKIINTDIKASSPNNKLNKNYFPKKVLHDFLIDYY